MLRSNHAVSAHNPTGLSDVAGTARRLWLRANAGRSLMKLNDQTLDDIGLSRDEVRRTLTQATLRDLRRLVYRH